MKHTVRRFSLLLVALMLLPTIVACNGGGNTASSTTIAQGATSITLDKTTITIAVGGSATLSATILPATADQTVNWVSATPAVATVTAGVVVGVSEGSAIIIATTSNGKVATCAVTVTASGVPGDSSTSGSSSAEPAPSIPTEPSNGLVYATIGAGVQVVGYTGSDTEVVIPATHEGKAVLAIADGAFLGFTQITHISIPESVLSIAANAFTGCTALTSMAFSISQLDSISNKTGLQTVVLTGGTDIPTNAFYGCSKLTSVTIGNSVTTIGDSAFRGCTGLTSVTIGNSVTTIGELAFYDCTGLTSVTIGNSVTTIGERAFKDCTKLKSVTIPNSVTIIGDYAFSFCTGLTSVTIGSSVTTIGTYAFSFCTKLTSVTIGSSVTTIGTSAFENCTGLERVYITDLAAWCGISFANSSANPLCYADNLYLNNALVTNLVIPNSVTTIGAYAFSFCTKLTSVTIPSSVTIIGDYAFSGCGKLVEVINLSNLLIIAGDGSYGYVAYNAKEVHEGTSKIVNQNGYLFYPCDSGNYLLGYTGTETALTLPANYNGANYKIYSYAFAYCSGLTSVTIPSSVTTIGGGAFKDCTKLTSVTIPSSVTTIGARAFLGCTGLTSVTIGSSVTTIGDDAFYGCTGLTSVTIPNSVTTIGVGAFYGCTGLTSVTIPSSVTTIGFSAFYGCTGLTSVTFENTSGWYITYSSDATSGTSMDVTTPATNASNLQNDEYSTPAGYAQYYWKRG